MDFSPIQTNERFASPNQNYTNALGVHFDNSGAVALAKQNVRSIGAVDAQIEQARDMYDSGKVLEANNEYNRLMSEGTMELMQKKQEKALNVVDEYDKLHQKTLETVRKKYGQFINYGKAGQAFNIFTEKDNNTRRQNMVKYQWEQTDAYHDTQFLNQLASCNQMILEGQGDNASIDGAFNRGKDLIATRYANYGKEMRELKERQFKNELVGNALQFAINTEDYKRMEEIIARYKGSVDSKTLSTIVGLVSKRRKSAGDLAFHEKMYANLGAYATPDQIKEYVRTHFTPAVSGRRGGNTPFDMAFKAIGGQESGGNYEAENERTGAYGKYQIMPDNWSSWAQEAGLSADAPQTPENQEIVARYKLNDYYNKYGAEGMCVGWYAGEVNASRWKDGMPTALGEDGEYSWDAPQGNGDEPSIREYVESVMGRAGGSMEYTDEMKEADLMDAEAKALKFYAERQAETSKTQSILLSEGFLEQDKLKVNGVTDPEAYDAIAMKYGCINGTTDDHVLVPLQKYGAKLREAASGKGGSGRKDPFLKEQIRQMLFAGYSDSDIYNYIFENGGSTEDVEMVRNYREGKGEFAEKWSAIKDKAKYLYQGDMEDFEMRFAESCRRSESIERDYVAEHNRQPSQDERLAWVLDGMFHPSILIDEGMFGFNNTVENRLSNGQYFDRGVIGEPTYDRSTGKFKVLLSNGVTYELTKEQFERVVNGATVQEVIAEDGGYIDG